MYTGQKVFYVRMNSMHNERTAENQIRLSASEEFSVRTEHASSENTKDVPIVICGCCLDEMTDIDSLVECRAGHLFCKSCVQRYVETQIFGQGSFGVDSDTKQLHTEIPCMTVDADCKECFMESELQKALSEKVMVKYQEMQRDVNLQIANIQTVTCPRCELLTEKYHEEEMTCEGCSFRWCLLCREEAHKPYKCERDPKGRLSIEEAVTQARVRNCPSCHRSIIKENGCNKMICPCKTTFCYLCRKRIDSEGYSHFCQTPHCRHWSCNKCSLSSNTKEEDERAMKVAREKATRAVEVSQPEVPMTGLYVVRDVAPSQPEVVEQTCECVIL